MRMQLVDCKPELDCGDLNISLIQPQISFDQSLRYYLSIINVLDMELIVQIQQVVT